jgi:hypothetical protein
MEMIDVVNKLIGRIQPIGESNEDAKRYNNLLAMCALTDQLITQIGLVSNLRNDGRGSMMKAGKYADEFLRDIKDSIRQ